MLRVSPDGKYVWVQTGQANTNVVLDAETMAVLQTSPTGKQPVQSAFQPNGGRYGLVTHFEDTFVLVLERQTGKEVTRIELGDPQANASFTPDGATAFVTVMGGDEVAVIDMAQLAVVGRIKTGHEPMGLVLLDPLTT
jgi:YVTN family beta-propeller protein